MDTTVQLGQVQRLKEILVQYATGDKTDNRHEYKDLRREVLTDPFLKSRLPKFVNDCGDLGEFWAVIKPMFPTYRERRDYLRKEFLPLLNELENRTLSPGNPAVTAALAKVDWEHVQDAWRKAIDRRFDDPDGAVTAARTLLETVCKHILDTKGIEYSDAADLQNLYDKTGKGLCLAPTSTMEPILRQILSGCYSVVNGVAALRNKASDAHGKGTAGASAKLRHAELAVNLAGAVASFLIASFEATTDGP
jgi:hypothetical protein